MRIWLIKEGEALPIMKGARRMRTGMLAEYLSKQGHDVIWWSSTYIHSSKTYISQEQKEILLADRERLILLHSKVCYKRNISLQREIYQEILAKEFRKQSLSREIPDIIVCSWPLMSLAKEAVRYGKKKQIPVVLDIRDQWPDIFDKIFPKPVRKYCRWLLWPIKQSARKILRSANGMIGVTQHMLEWGCAYAGRMPGKNDRCIYIGNEKIQMSGSEQDAKSSFWKSKNISENTWNICFFSSLSARSLDLDTLIQAVLELSKEYKEVRLVIGGEGDDKKRLMAMASNSENVVFAGWLDNHQMNSLMRISKAGAYCMKNLDDFKNTFGNKAIQYLSAGLPILNSLQGFAKEYLRETRIGLTYQERDIDDCVRKIKMMYQNEDFRREMGIRASKEFEAKYDSRIVNRQYEEYLLSVKEHYQKEVGV